MTVHFINPQKTCEKCIVSSCTAILKSATYEIMPFPVKISMNSLFTQMINCLHKWFTTENTTHTSSRSSLSFLVSTTKNSSSANAWNKDNQNTILHVCRAEHTAYIVHCFMLMPLCFWILHSNIYTEDTRGFWGTTQSFSRVHV